jgi:DNA-binding NtrC family response regulator
MSGPCIQKNRAWATRRIADPAPEVVGNSKPVQRLRSLISVVSKYDCTVLICGETGTGKELISRAIHAASDRAAGPFITVDCTTLRDTLFESQLFGHEKGAFTGAEHDTLGFFRAADHGTLFLDEIGELDPAIQGKLLRCIQEGAVIPLGGIKPVKVSVRLIAATHRDLREMVRHGKFREDLFFRLNVVCLSAPPLRERMSDVPALAECLLNRLAVLYGKPEKSLAPEAMDVVQAYTWPGNVRELANALEHAFIFSGGSRITVSDLPDELRLVTRVPMSAGGWPPLVSLADAERAMILQALLQTAGNRAQAARILQINRKRLYRKIRSYKIKLPVQTV